MPGYVKHHLFNVYVFLFQKVPPITPFMKFTFFNVSNVDEVRAGTAKPSVTEVGPFSYREVREKTNILSIQDEISFGRCCICRKGFKTYLIHL